MNETGSANYNSAETVHRGRVTEQWLHDHKNYPHDDCLIWPFSREKRVGRGMVNIPGKSRWAHRIMCEMAHGAPPSPKHQAAHECGKGHEGCVNPRHLKWKTHSENQLDRAAHGTVIRSWTKKITAAQGAQMRALRPAMKIMEIAERFGCSYGAVCYHLKYREQRGHAAGIQPHWTPEEDASLRGAIPNRCWREVGEIVGRSAEACASRAAKLGLKSGWVRPGKRSSEPRFQ